MKALCPRFLAADIHKQSVGGGRHGRKFHSHLPSHSYLPSIPLQKGGSQTAMALFPSPLSLVQPPPPLMMTVCLRGVSEKEELEEVDFPVLERKNSPTV